MAFFSQVLHNYEAKYSFVKKHVLFVVRSLNKFRHMLSNKKIQLLVAHSIVKDFLLSKDINDKRASWITKVMEYDIKIKVTKLIKGKGLCEQLVELAGNAENSKIIDQQVETVLNNDEQVVVPITITNWIQ